MPRLDEYEAPEDRTEGWKPDPLGSDRPRWWDGENWTGKVGKAETRKGFWESIGTWPLWAKIVVPIVGVLFVIAVATSEEPTEEKSDTDPPAKQASADDSSSEEAPAEEAPAEAPEEKPSPQEILATANDELEESIDTAANDTSGVENVVVACQRLKSCYVEYDIELLGLFEDTELVSIQSDVWKAMFDEERVKDGTILMSGEVTTIGGKTEHAPVLKVSCDRWASDQIDWEFVDLEGLKVLCDYRELVNFD